MRKPKKLEYTFLIICEGDNTEPSFFKIIRDRVIDGIYKIHPYEKDEIAITIRPEPKDNSDEGQAETNTSPHKPKRNNKKLKKLAGESEEKSAPYPLNFILEGQVELEDETFDEVWAVFDHDNHPARKAAFDESNKTINGKKINIAFSSIGFEYYLLIHFEKVYNAFKTSECREGKAKNKKLFYCGTGTHPSDCNGHTCIGGYARNKGFWVNSKTPQSTFLLVEDKLEVGFINSAWIRYQSYIENNTLNIYERNPYLTTDLLIKRLTGFDNYIYEWLSPNVKIDFENILILVNSDRLYIKNTSVETIIIPENSISLKNLNHEGKSFGNKLSLKSQEESFIEIPKGEIGNVACFIFTYRGFKKIFVI